MNAFLAPMRQLGEFEEISRKLPANRGVLQVTGCIDSQKPHFIYCAGETFQEAITRKKISRGAGRPFVKLIVTYSDLRAKELYESCRFFDRDVLYFPAKDLIFFQADIHSNLLEQQRVAVFKALAEREQVTIVTTMAACMNHLIPFSLWKDQIMTVEGGTELDVEKLKKELVRLGYERTGQVEGPGQFAVRGGIIDIFPLTEENPVRIELWGEEVDSIRSFDAESQRSIENLDAVRIYPAAELIPDERMRQDALGRIEREAKRAEQVFRKEGKTEEAAQIRKLMQDCRDQIEELGEPLSMEGFIDYFFPASTSFPDYFDEERTLIFLDEPNRLLESGQAVETEFRESMEHRLEKGYVLAGQTGLLFSCQETAVLFGRRNAVGLCTLENARAPWSVSEKFSLTVRSVNPYNNSFELLVKDLKRWKKEGYRVILLAASRTRGKRLAVDLLEEGLSCFYTEEEDRAVQAGEILITYGNAQRGYEYPLIKFVVIAESDIFGQEQKKKKKRRRYEGK